MSLELMKNYYYLAQWNPTSFPNYVEVIPYLELSLNTGGCIDNLVHCIYRKQSKLFSAKTANYRGYDITKKLKIIRKSSRYQDLAHKLLQYRNIIIHKNHLDINLIQDITISVIALYTADHNFCDKKFFEEWNQIYYIILEKAPPTIMKIDLDINKFYNIFSTRWEEVYDNNLFQK